MNIKNYFGKDWKFFWKTSWLYKNTIQSFCAYFGIRLFILSRKLMRIGAKNCSWCGDSQNINTGLFMSYSKKGLRCSNKDCMEKPYV